MRHFDLPIQGSYLIQRVQVRRKPSMQAEDLVLDNSSQRKEVKQIGVIFPDIGVSVLPQTLIVEPIHLSNLPRLVVSSQDRDPILESHLQRNQQSHSLNRVVASVHVVTHKEIIRVWGPPSNLEELHEIMELPVDISAHSNRAFHWLHVAFFRQNLFGLEPS